MKCPLLSIVDHQTYQGEAKVMPDCLKEECAWWSKELEQCDSTGLLQWFIKLELLLEEALESRGR